MTKLSQNISGHSGSDMQKGVLSLVVLSAVYASMGIWARGLSHDFLIFQQVYLRVFVALGLSLIFLHRKLDYSKLARISRNEWLLLAARGLLAGVTVVIFSQAVIDTKLGNVAFIQSLPFIALFGIIFFKERLSWQKLLFIILSLIGVFLIAVSDYHNLLHWGRGEFLSVILGLCFALLVVSRKWHSKLLNNYEITTTIFVFQAVSILMISIAVGEGIPKFQWHPWVLATLLMAGIMNVVNFNLANYGFSKVNNILAGNVLTLEAFWSVVFGFLIFRETLSVKEFMVGLLIILGVIGMNRLTGNE